MDMRKKIVILTIFCIKTAYSDDCQPIVESIKRLGIGNVFKYNGICYVFINHEKTWLGARERCENWGGDMVQIPDSGTMEFLMKTMDNQLRWSNNGVWIGLHSRGSGGWRWTTGDAQTYSYWDSGQPSKMFGLISFEDCACMRRKDGWRWHDYFCDNKFYTYKYICQFHSSIGVEVASRMGGSKRDDGLSDSSKGAIIGFVLGGFIVLVICCMVFILFRRRRRRKRESDDLVVQFENSDYMHGYTQGYSPVSQTETNVNVNRESHMYMDTDEMNRLYERVTKQVDHGVNNYDQLKPKTGACCAEGGNDDVDDECDLKKEKVYLPEERNEASHLNNDYVDMGGNKPKLTNLEVNTRNSEKQSNIQEPLYNNETFHRERLHTPTEEELETFHRGNLHTPTEEELEVLDYEEHVPAASHPETDPLYDTVK